MADNATTEPSHQLRGTSFESMHEAFTGIFGPFDAEPLGRAHNFRWSADCWMGSNAVLLASSHQAECFMRATTDTTEYLAVVVPRSGYKEVRLGLSSVGVGPGQMLISHTHDAERIILRHGPIELDGLLLDRAILAQAVNAVFETPLIGRLDLTPVLDLTASSGRPIGHLVQTIIEGMRNDGPLLYSPLAMANLISAFADLTVRLLPHRLSHLIERKPGLIAPWHVRRAVDFMHANIDRPITTPMVAEAIGASVRALESGFRAFKETTPAAYLRRMRLEAARRDLLDPSNRQPIKDICLKWGFFHFGRFAILYRTAYGESPSDTRKRSSG